MGASWDWDFVFQIFPKLLEGLFYTVIATLLGSALGLILGFAIALGQTSKNKFVHVIITVYLYIIRGAPLLILLYIVFYVFPLIPLVGIALSPLEAGVLTYGMVYATYFGETFRSGIQAVPKQQWEAAKALNFTMPRTWISVIFPQMLRPIIPALGNYVNLMFKVSALLAAISVHELFGNAQVIGNFYYRYLEPMTIAGILYLTVSVPVTLLVKRIEKGLQVSAAR